MVIGVLQPGYLPWLGFFEQLHRADVFVLYDDVQYDKGSWRNRNRIKTANGVSWLTVPVLVRFEERPAVNAVRIDNRTNWRRKHLLSIAQSYSKAPWFDRYMPVFEEAYAREWEYLIDLDLHFIGRLARCLGMDAGEIVLSSSLGIGGDRVARLVEICRRFGADTFYEGSTGRDYIEEEEFLRAGIRVVYQDYDHPEYRQLHGPFVPYLSVVDLLFNHGPESLGILTNSASGKN